MAGAATLVVGPSWVGDMVMAQSLFRLLAERRPDSPIDVLAPSWSLPIVARMPEVRRGIPAETAHGDVSWGKRRRIGRELRDKYAHAIVLPRSFKSALVPWFARVPRRTGYRGEMRYGLLNDIRPFDADVLDQTVKRYVALGLDRGEAHADALYPALEISADNQEQLRFSLGLDAHRPPVVFMPGAEYGPAKCWPLPHFAELARLLVSDGFQVWVMGSEKDAAAGEEIMAAVRGDDAVLNLCGKTALADVIDLLGLAEQAVSNDSGLMHIAAAVGIHVHAIYGSSSPEFTPPLTARADIHYLDLECSPCFERRCPLGHLNCLRQIGADELHIAVRRRSEMRDLPDRGG